MTYQISSLFFFFSPFLLAFVFAVVSLHDPFRGELGKNAVAKSMSEQCEAPVSPRSPYATVLSMRSLHTEDSPSHSVDYLQRSERGASLLCFLFLPW